MTGFMRPFANAALAFVGVILAVVAVMLWAGLAMKIGERVGGDNDFLASGLTMLIAFGVPVATIAVLLAGGAL